MAEDTDRARGAGPEALATAETLAILLYGRRIRSEDLAGDGADVVVARL